MSTIRNRSNCLLRILLIAALIFMVPVMTQDTVESRGGVDNVEIPEDFDWGGGGEGTTSDPGPGKGLVQGDPVAGRTDILQTISLWLRLYFGTRW